MLVVSFSLSSRGLIAFLTSGSEGRVHIQFDHLSDNLIVGTVQFGWVEVLAWLISTFLHNPFFLTWLELSHEGTIVFANHSLQGVIISIAKIIGTFWDVARTIDIVDYQSLAIWTKTLNDLSVETAIFVS